MKAYHSRSSGILVFFVGLAFFLLVLNPVIVFADADAQSPNQQILSSNTSNDTGSWDRFSIDTESGFKVNGSAYTYQMNSILNGCTAGYCSKTWWMQGIIGVDSGSLISKPAGYYVHDAHIELWDGSTDDGTFCDLTIPKFININNTVFNTNIQITNSTSGLKIEVATADENNSTVFYDVSKTCGLPSGFTSVNYFTQVEGVIVGCGAMACGTHEKFTPLSTEIFYAYIDLTSNYNDLSNSSKTTQTGESSNLYQEPINAYGTTYGSLYLYTVQSDEDTKTAS